MARRISDEDGVNAGVRNIGRFWLFAIPAVLALAGSLWLGVYIGLHQFRRELSQEERAAIAVGSAVRPKSKVEIKIVQTGCAPITRVDLDGASLRMYASNDCHREIESLAWHYELVSPNGTVLGDGLMYRDCPSPRLHGDKAECLFGRYRFNADDRASQMRVWTSAYFK